MESIALSSTPRTNFGKGAARKIRAAGSVPAILYGHGIDGSTSVTLQPRDLSKALDGPKGSNALIELSIEGGEKHSVLVREIQRHPVSRKILHVDLVAPNPETRQVAVIPVSFSGKCPGVALGGNLRTPYREIKVLAKAADIPAEIAVDVSTLSIGDGVMSSELVLPEGVSAVNEADFVIARVMKPRGQAIEGDEEATATGGEAEESE
jgi:large subunit ribosomal protein L25